MRLVVRRRRDSTGLRFFSGRLSKWRGPRRPEWSDHISDAKLEQSGDIDMKYPAKPGALKAPGATIYYEVRGSGPLLVMIPGGPTDAGVMADLARKLADRYTVVAYDPRGNSRSAVQGAPGDLQIDIH